MSEFSCCIYSSIDIFPVKVKYSIPETLWITIPCPESGKTLQFLQFHYSHKNLGLGGGGGGRLQ